MSGEDFCDICGEYKELIYTEEGQLCVACMYPADAGVEDKVISFDTLDSETQEGLAYA